MHKSHRNSGSTVFYKSPSDTTEIRSGFLYKSPPQRKLNTEKSWKKRYFILFKVNEQQYQFWYFKSPDEKDNPIGSIDLTQISQLYVNPQSHPKWGWVQRSLRCPPSCVLYIKTENRDYFLVGDNSIEVDSWFSDLFDALKHHANFEEIKKGQTAVEVISSPCAREKSPEVTKNLVVEVGEAGSKYASKLFLPPPTIKNRCMSDPSSNTVDNDTEKAKEEDNAQRRASAPHPIYEKPRSYLRSNVGENSLRHSISMESLYITMKDIPFDENAAQRVFTTGIPPLSTNEGEMATDDREEKRQSSGFGSCSSDPISPEELLKEQSTTESLDLSAAGERDFEVKQADLKKHLTLTDIDGKPSVSAWTGQPQIVCLFHKGDQILAVNDLHTGSMEEFNLYISKSLKNEVKVTILRQPGCKPLHLPNCPCTG